MKSWYVVKTKPHSEFKAINFLKSKNIVVFMPKLLVTVSHARQVKEVLRPLFPSYFFTYINVDQSFRLIKNTIGVKGLLSFGEIPSTVAESEMRCLFDNTDNNGIIKKLSISKFKIGQKVSLDKGLFKGKIGSFYSLSAKERIFILLDFFGRKSKVSVSHLNVSGA